MGKDAEYKDYDATDWYDLVYFNPEKAKTCD